MGLSNVATGSSGLLAGVVGGLVLDFVTNGAVGPSSPSWSAGPRVSFLVAVALYAVAALVLIPVVEPRRVKSPAALPLPV
jgi:hypothetical protein